MQRQHITVSVQDIVDTLEISKKLVLSFKNPCNLNALIVKQPTLNFLGRYIYPSDSEVIKINMGTKCFYEFISALMIKTWKKFEVNIFFESLKEIFVATHYTYTPLSSAMSPVFEKAIWCGRSRPVDLLFVNLYFLIQAISSKTF